VRTVPVALTFMGQARARKHDTDFSNRLTDQAFGLLGRDAILAIIGLQNAGKLGLMEPEDGPMALTITNHLTAVRMPRTVPGSATAQGS
jgi:hypothetical protein